MDSKQDRIVRIKRSIEQYIGKRDYSGKVIKDSHRHYNEFFRDNGLQITIIDKNVELFVDDYLDLVAMVKELKGNQNLINVYRIIAITFYVLLARFWDDEKSIIGISCDKSDADLENKYKKIIVDNSPRLFTIIFNNLLFEMLYLQNENDYLNCLSKIKNEQIANLEEMIFFEIAYKHKDKFSQNVAGIYTINWLILHCYDIANLLNFDINTTSNLFENHDGSITSSKPQKFSIEYF